MPHNNENATSHLPSVSVVIPAYNRAEFVQTCLASVFSQTYPLDRYEVILVDDGSTDRTVEQVRELAQQWGGSFRLIQKPNGGPASARNAGFRASQAEIIAFIDSDCVAEAGWLEKLVSALAASDASGVGGPLANVSPKGWVSHYLNCTSFFRHRVRHGKVDYLLTANVAFRRSALLAVNGFSEMGVWGEDADLSFRLVQAGYPLLLTGQGIVTHYGTPVSIYELIKNLYRYGYGNYVLSHNWRNGRTPLMEITRHGGAVFLSPLLALRYVSTTGIGWAISFWPLIIIEHTAFLCGLMTAMSQEAMRGSKWQVRSS